MKKRIHPKLERSETFAGHEHPFSIKMSHIRDWRSDEGGFPMELDQSEGNNQCHFILKDSKKAPEKFSIGNYALQYSQFS